MEIQLIGKANTEIEKVRQKVKINKIKDQILSNSKRATDIIFEKDCNSVRVVFDDGASLTVKSVAENDKSLSYDDNKEGYAVYFGEEASGDGRPGYFKVVF